MGSSAAAAIPAYGVSEAARYLRVAPATLRSWVAGRHYPSSGGDGFFAPLIAPAAASPPQLSFENLIEAHVLRALRVRHDVPVRHVRTALAYAQNTLGIDRLLLSRELSAHAGEVLLEKYGQLVNLSRSGQLALKHLFGAHLERVDWSERDIPVRLFPFGPPASGSGARVIAIDPCLRFGRPVVYRVGVSTEAIAQRIDAGESPGDVAQDYGLGPEEVATAVLFEQAA